MSKARATWFCIDIEANGPVAGLYDMVSLGATVVFRDADGQLRLGDDFYMELQPVAPRFDARAAAIHGLEQARLHAEGLDREAAAEALQAWVQDQTRPHTKPVFVGHNAPFDWGHVAYLYAELSRQNPFGYKALDTKALAAGVLNIHWLDTGKDILFARLGLPPEDKQSKHRADYDARVQAELFVALLNHQAES